MFGLGKKPSRTVSVTATTVVVLFAGYIAQYMYQLMFLTYFGLPPFLVDVTFFMALITGFVLVAALAIIIVVFDLLSGWRPSTASQHGVRSTLLSVLLVVAVSPIVIALYDSVGSGGYWYAAIATVTVITFAFYQYYRGGIKKQHANAMEWYGHNHALLPSLLVFGLVISALYGGLFGYVVAKNKETYFTSNKSPYYAVIASYKDSFVMLDVNNDKTFESRFNVMTDEDISAGKVLFTEKKIGPLRSKK